MLKTKKALDRRDRRLLHALRVAATEAMWQQAHGHANGWDKLQKALDKADDEMGPVEDFEI